jgi:competence protein ComEC
MVRAGGWACQSCWRRAGRLVERAPANFESWLLSERKQLPLWAPVALGIGIVAYFLLPWT